MESRRAIIIGSVVDTTGKKRNRYNIVRVYGRVKQTYVDGTGELKVV